MAPGKPCSLCGLLTNKSWISLISCLKIKIQAERGGTIPDTADCCWLSCFKYFIADRIQWNINLRGPAGFMQPLSPRIKLRTTQSIFAKSHIMGQWILSTWIRGQKVERQVYLWLLRMPYSVLRNCFRRPPDILKSCFPELPLTETKVCWSQMRLWQFGFEFSRSKTLSKNRA